MYVHHHSRFPLAAGVMMLQVDPKKRLEAEVASLMGTSILQVLGTMVDTVVF